MKTSKRFAVFVEVSPVHTRGPGGDNWFTSRACVAPSGRGERAPIKSCVGGYGDSASNAAGRALYKLGERLQHKRRSVTKRRRG